MVKKIGKFFIYFAFFLGALLFFLPKVSLYHFGERMVKPYGVVISNEKVFEKGFSLQIEDATLYFKKIPSVTFKNLDISMLGVYNSCVVEDISLAKALKSFAPTHIDRFEANYSIVDPLNIYGSVLGEFGSLTLEFNLIERKIQVFLQPSKMMKTKYRSTLRNFKKLKTGGYIYEKSI